MRAPAGARQLGQVIMVKSNFGFIKCCERADDIFFHFTAVVAKDPQHPEPRVGDEVEFAVCTLQGRDHAVQVTPIVTRAVAAGPRPVSVSDLALWASIGRQLPLPA